MPSFFSSVTICKVNANWHEVSFYISLIVEIKFVIFL
jgi:hypothetical protein